MLRKQKKNSQFAPGVVCALLSLSSTNCTQVPVHHETIQTYRERQRLATPTTILADLRLRNLRFSKGKSEQGGFPLDARERRENSASSQRPLAAVLSCIDSRTTPELVFDSAVGDLFTARVGANVINDDILGSLEIAAESGVRVIVVLGHTDCGGIKAACSDLKLGHMTQLLSRVKPAIKTANERLDQDRPFSLYIGERTVNNRRYIAHVSHMNALQSANQIRERSPILRDKIESGVITLVTAVYDVDTGLVTFDVP